MKMYFGLCLQNHFDNSNAIQLNIGGIFIRLHFVRIGFSCRAYKIHKILMTFPQRMKNGTWNRRMNVSTVVDYLVNVHFCAVEKKCDERFFSVDYAKNEQTHQPYRSQLVYWDIQTMLFLAHFIHWKNLFRLIRSGAI